MCFYLLSVMAYFYIVIIINCHRIGYKRKYVYNIKQERSYNNDLVGIFERYKDIADGDMEVAMNFIKEAYPFNEETESFIRKKFDMPMPDESKE